jgi:1-acyl-sn-glycerol-3-phosphate acyltransferase
MFRSLSRLIFRAAGWRTEGALPESHRCVLIAAPHTSNWDGLLLVLAAQIFRMHMSFFIKESWFVFPFGYVLRRFGGIPINRGGRNRVVEKAIEQFAHDEKLVLAVPPEGTRKKTAHWKTGFYYIALGANVPIVLGYLDYERKIAGLGPAFMPTGDLDADFAVFRKFYADVKGCYPEKFSDVSPPPRESRTN